MRPRSFTVSGPLVIHLFDSSPFPLVRNAIFLHYLKELVDGLRLAALEVLSAWPEAQSRDCGFDDWFLSHLRSPCAKPDEAMEVLLEAGNSLLQIVEVARRDFIGLWSPGRGRQIRSQLVPCADVAVWEV